MKKQSKNEAYRRPVGGYGTRSVRRYATITLSESLDSEVRVDHPNFAEYVRGLIVRDYRNKTTRKKA